MVRLSIKVKEIKGSSVVAERRGRELFRAKNLIKVVKQRPEYLKETEKEKTKKVVEEDIDIDMDKIRRRVAEMEREIVEGAERAGVDQTAQPTGDQEEKGSISGDSDDSRFTITYDDQEDREVEEQEAEPVGTSSPISNRTRNRATRKEPGQRAQLSPRERKRRKAQAVKRDKQQRYGTI